MGQTKIKNKNGEYSEKYRINFGKDVGNDILALLHPSKCLYFTLNHHIFLRKPKQFPDFLLEHNHFQASFSLLKRHLAIRVLNRSCNSTSITPVLYFPSAFGTSLVIRWDYRLDFSLDHGKYLGIGDLHVLEFNQASSLVNLW